MGLRAPWMRHCDFHVQIISKTPKDIFVLGNEYETQKRALSLSLKPHLNWLSKSEVKVLAIMSLNLLCQKEVTSINNSTQISLLIFNNKNTKTFRI